MKIHPGGGGPKKALRCWFESDAEKFSATEKDGYSELVFYLKPITGRLAVDIKSMRGSVENDGELTASLVETVVDSVGGFEDPDGQPITKLDHDTVLAIHPKILQFIAFKISEATMLSGDELNFIKLPVDGS